MRGSADNWVVSEVEDLLFFVSDWSMERFAGERKVIPRHSSSVSRPALPIRWYQSFKVRVEWSFHWTTRGIARIWTPNPNASVQIAILVLPIKSWSMVNSFELWSSGELYARMMSRLCSPRLGGSRFRRCRAIRLASSWESTYIRVCGCHEC